MEVLTKFTEKVQGGLRLEPFLKKKGCMVGIKDFAEEGSHRQVSERWLHAKIPAVLQPIGKVFTEMTIIGLKVLCKGKTPITSTFHVGTRGL